jgi:hypothetical protein
MGEQQENSGAVVAEQQQQQQHVITLALATPPLPLPSLLLFVSLAVAVAIAHAPTISVGLRHATGTPSPLHPCPPSSALAHDPSPVSTVVIAKKYCHHRF